MKNSILTCLLSSILISRASCIVVLDSNELVPSEVNASSLNDFADAFGTTGTYTEEENEEAQGEYLETDDADISTDSAPQNEVEELPDINESLEMTQVDFAEFSAPETSQESNNLAESLDVEPDEDLPEHRPVYQNKQTADIHVEDITDVNERNSALSSQVLGKLPLCNEESYLSCVNDAKNAFQVCSVENKACHCYYAGAAIVECAKFCSTYNLNSFYHFKTTCSGNPYVLNLDKDMFCEFKNQNLKVISLINELNSYKNIHNKRKNIAKQMNQDFNHEQNNNIGNSFYANNIITALFDNVRIAEPQWKPFERDDLEQHEANSQKIESEIQIERQNHEAQKLIQLEQQIEESDAYDDDQEILPLDNQNLQSSLAKNISTIVNMETSFSLDSSSTSNATSKFNANHKIEDGSEKSSGKIAATLQKSYILGALVIILTSLLT